MSYDEASPARWVATHVLHWGAWSTSFQRFELPGWQHIMEVPSSLGALPVASHSGEWLMPLSKHEAFWIGIEALDAHPEIQAELVVSGRDGIAPSIIVDPAIYALSTCLSPPSPLERSTGYSGWLLP